MPWYLLKDSGCFLSREPNMKVYYVLVLFSHARIPALLEVDPHLSWFLLVTEASQA